MNLYTLDEARVAFCRSALTVLDTVNASETRICRLIAGRGGRRALAAHECRVIYEHWALIAELEDAGYGWAIEGEIEGVISCIEAEGVNGAYSIIEDELPADDTEVRSPVAA